MLVQNNIDPVLENIADQHIFSFGSFRLDASRGVLMHNGVNIFLRPKTFDVLTYLLNNAGRVISRKELLEGVWTDVIVTDDSLTQCLIEIRKALGDDQRKIVRTVPRRGYLFDLPVSVSAPAGIGHAEPERQRWRQPSLWTLVAVAVLAVAIGSTWLRVGFLPRQPVSEPAGVHPSGQVAIAVLPFVDLSKEGDQVYLADGISEEILNLLTQVSGLTVIARTSSFSIRDQNLDIIDIAQRLNVTHILEGSVRKSGDRVRVTAQLVDGESAVHLWSQTYDDRLDDVFAVQTGIARAVAGVLASKLLANDQYAAAHFETIPGSRNMDAWNLYLRGKYFYGRRSPGDVLRAQRYFEDALSLDPELAAAWIGLASTLNLRWMLDELPEGESLPAEEVQPLMKYAVEKTLELDPQNPEALMRLASLNLREGNIERFYDLIYQAMPYGRNSALVQSMLAGIAFSASDTTTAVKLQSRAVRLEPISFSQNNNLAYYLYWAGQLDDSAALYRQSYEINPGQQGDGKDVQAWILIHQHKYANAEAVAELLPVGPTRDAVWSMLYYQAGNDGESDAALNRLKQISGIESLVRITYVYAFRGETDAAFHSLEAATRALMAGSDANEAGFWFTELRASRFLQSLHTDDRWAEWETKTEKLLYDPLDVELAQSLKQYAETGLPESL